MLSSAPSWGPRGEFCSLCRAECCPVTEHHKQWDCHVRGGLEFIISLELVPFSCIQPFMINSLKKTQLLFLELHRQDESSYCSTWCPAQVAAHQNRPVHSLAASHKGKQTTKELVQELVATSKILIGKCIFIFLAACSVFHYIPCYLASVLSLDLELSLECFFIFALFSSNIKYWKCFWCWAFVLYCFVLLDFLININLIDLSYLISIFFLLLENIVELTHFAENRWHWNGFYCTSRKDIS